MPSSLVLTVIGPDRPGLVDLLSRTVAGHGANWLESRMAHLDGRFAGLLRVHVPEARAVELTAALRALERDGLRVQVEAGDAPPSDPRSRLLELELVGLDRPGIIRDVSRALAQRGVNVEELDTSCESAAMSGETLFRARARLRVPGDVPQDELRATLEKLAGELMVDLSLDAGAS
jgi:glycine cleavage system regulatory protein